jgi:hypothetical protein
VGIRQTEAGSGTHLDADELNMEISGDLLDQSFDDCAHDLGFPQADFKDFLVRDNQLGRVLDDLPFELNERKKR